jgi:hypothetical protein
MQVLQTCRASGDMATMHGGVICSRQFARTEVFDLLKSASLRNGTVPNQYMQSIVQSQLIYQEGAGHFRTPTVG